VIANPRETPLHETNFVAAIAKISVGAEFPSFLSFAPPATSICFETALKRRPEQPDERPT
jgi:hypothetical protein